MSVDRRIAARTLREIAAVLEVRGDNPHRVRAFINAARAVERVEGDLAAMAASGELLSVRGLGKGTASVIEELASGRRPAVLEEAERAVPQGVREMMELPGLGPKKVRALWRELGVTNLGELEYACRENRLLELAGFGEATQARVLEGIRFRRQAGERRLMSEAHEVAAAIVEVLDGAEGVVEVMPVGEVRRCCETVGTVELVVAADDVGRAAGRIERMLHGLEHDGAGVVSGTAPDGRALRLMVVPAGDAAAALLWHTGSGEHLASLAERARASGMVLDARGLARGEERLAVGDEKDLYRALGCRWVPPELREGGDEVRRAAAGELPELVERHHLLGALHNHTVFSDGAASVAEMRAAARTLGWAFLGVADHSPAASYANGVDAARLREQWRVIDELNAAGGGPRVVKGLEADILGDGSLDVPEGCEAELEYVVASVHSSFRLEEARQTERLLKAVRHPACRVLGHPTGRLLLAREGYAVDLDPVLEVCAKHGVAVEINASPYRLDLDWRWARRALDLGVRLVIDPDAHSAEGLADVRWGLAVARKAGATAADLVNCSPIEEFLNQR